MIFGRRARGIVASGPAATIPREWMIFGRRARGIVAAGPDAVNAALTAPRQRVPLPRNPTVSPFSDLAEHCSSSNTRCPAQNTLARSPMSEMQARHKPEFSLRYPRLSAGVWYDV